MKTVLVSVFALFGSVASAAVVTTCAANNCLRQVRATATPSRAMVDCSRYQTTTTTPTVTAGTATVFSSVASNNAGAPPAPINPAIPAYASSCSNDALYRSACSCVGSTSTNVAAATAVTVPASTKTCSAFVLQATSGAYAGNYLVQVGADDVFFTGSDQASALQFEFRGDQRLYQVNGGDNALVATSNSLGSVFINSYFLFPSAVAYYPLDCTINAAAGLSCTVEQNSNINTFSYSPQGDGNLQIGQSGQASNSLILVPKAVCVA